MKHTKELTMFKVIAVGAAMLYLYKLNKAQGTSMAGKINPDNIAKLASHLFPHEYRREAQMYGSQIIRKVML